MAKVMSGSVLDSMNIRSQCLMTLLLDQPSSSLTPHSGADLTVSVSLDLGISDGTSGGVKSPVRRLFITTMVERSWRNVVGHSKPLSSMDGED